MLAVSLSSAAVAQSTSTFDTLSMGPSYINDIYYSLENGTVGTSPRNTWDLAFYTPRFSAGIIINEGYGVTLYSYPNGDTSAWATLDTVGMTSWKAINNSPTIWEDGAPKWAGSSRPFAGVGIWASWVPAFARVTALSVYLTHSQMSIRPP